MRRARDSKVPSTPLTLNEMNNILSDPSWKAWTLLKNSRNERFFLRKFDAGGTNLAFTSSGKSLRNVDNETAELFIGFIQARPRHPSTLKAVVFVGLFAEREGQPTVSIGRRIVYKIIVKM